MILSAQHIASRIAHEKALKNLNATFLTRANRKFDKLFLLLFHDKLTSLSSPLKGDKKLNELSSKTVVNLRVHEKSQTES